MTESEIARHTAARATPDQAAIDDLKRNPTPEVRAYFALHFGEDALKKALPTAGPTPKAPADVVVPPF
jgi:hypothetical protein